MSSTVNLQELRKGLTELREGLKKIREELAEHFADIDADEKYGRQMLSFVRSANGQVEDLTADVMNAESTFAEVLRFYGEEDRNMSSSEFYGIFKTFVTSYKVGVLSFRRCLTVDTYREEMQIG